MNVYLPNLRLPSAYQEVEYIQSSGTQYINTGYTPTTSTRFAGKYNITSKPTEYGVLMAVRSNSSYPPQNTLYIGWRNLSERQGLIYIMPSTYDYGNNSYGGTIGVDYEISYNGSVLKNGTSSINISFTSAPTKSIYLFANNDINGYTGNENGCAKLYYMKFYNSDTLVRDFVPCYRKSDSVIGLYDLVNNQFYTNSGTGTFSKGNDVTMSVLKNAYIGEVYEYSYDFRNKSSTILTNDGWTKAGSTPSFNSYGMTGSIIRYTKPISLSNAKKLVLSYTGTGGSDDEYGFRVGQTVTSSTRSGLTGTLYSINNIYMNIYGTSQSYSGVSSGYHKVECIMDFTAKTFQIKLDGASFQNGTLTDTQISNIKNNTTVTFAYVSGFGSDYGLESIYILIEK